MHQGRTICTAVFAGLLNGPLTPAGRPGVLMEVRRLVVRGLDDRITYWCPQCQSEA